MRHSSGRRTNINKNGSLVTNLANESYRVECSKDIYDSLAAVNKATEI